MATPPTIATTRIHTSLTFGRGPHCLRGVVVRICKHGGGVSYSTLYRGGVVVDGVSNGWHAISQLGKCFHARWYPGGTVCQTIQT